MTQVSELTYIIKQDIQLLNTSLVDLQRLSAKGRNESNKQSQDHSHTVVDSLRSRLKDATQVSWCMLARVCFHPVA